MAYEVRIIALRLFSEVCRTEQRHKVADVGLASGDANRGRQRLCCTYPAAKVDITRLIAAGILSEVPYVRPKTFFALGA